MSFTSLGIMVNCKDNSEHVVSEKTKKIMKNKNTQGTFPKVSPKAPGCGLRKRPFKPCEFEGVAHLDAAHIANFDDRKKTNFSDRWVGCRNTTP